MASLSSDIVHVTFVTSQVYLENGKKVSGKHILDDLTDDIDIPCEDPDLPNQLDVENISPHSMTI